MVNTVLLGKHIALVVQVGSTQAMLRQFAPRAWQANIHLEVTHIATVVQEEHMQVHKEQSTAVNVQVEHIRDWVLSHVLYVLLVNSVTAQLQLAQVVAQGITNLPRGNRLVLHV